MRNLIHAQPTSREDAKIVAGRAVAWAEEHLFDRRSVVNEHELWRHALGYARGQNVTLKDIQAVTGKRNYIRDVKHAGKVTTREHLQQEWEIVEMVHKGLRRHHSFCKDYCCANPSLDAEQRLAVERILVWSGFVAIFRGGAGTGKSYTLREVEKALKETGRAVHVIAPQRQQVMNLEKDGFQNVETVSAFLAKGSLEPHSVIIVDEAGQIGGKQMHTLLEFALGRALLTYGRRAQRGEPIIPSSAAATPMAAMPKKRRRLISSIVWFVSIGESSWFDGFMVL